MIKKLKGYFFAPDVDVETGRSREKYVSLFVCAFLGMLICFIPSMIKNNGIFMYYGDFNSQQLMFYKHMQEMVKNGNFGWDWGTDLGTGVVSTWSFYLLGSPFFWLTTLFPVGDTVYLMPWLLCLKTAVAAVCAYAYLRRFVNNKNAAFIGSMLYAFSGFQTYNIFFNHFHDATAFFPLMLLGFEMLVKDNKKGVFALTVALSAFISYFFLVCEAVFIVVYFFLRCLDKDFDVDMKKFINLLIEACIGGFIAAVMLLPSVLQVMNNNRVDSRLIGLDIILYGDKARIGRIFQAFFTLSDMPARVNLFDVNSARWASIAGYLPLFSMCGVIAYYRIRNKAGKKDWLCWSLIVFIIMACVPILNSSFILFNSSYYARWFYMPILLFCLMTAKVIDEDPVGLKKGFLPTILAGIGFLGVGSLPKYIDGKLTYFHLAVYPELYYIQIGVTAMMMIMLAILVKGLLKKGIRDKINFGRIAAWMTVVACVICNTSEVLYGVAQGGENKDYAEIAIFGSRDIDMDKLESRSANYSPTNNFYRIDSSENVDNFCMFWGLSSMRCFHSCVTPAILDFYAEIGQTRDVASRMDKKVYPLRGLFSVKYYFDQLDDAQREGTKENDPDQDLFEMEDFHYVDTQNKFNVYENEYYVPMGFAFDHYTNDKTVKDAGEVEKTQILMKALVLNDNQAAQYSDIISYYNFEDSDYTKEAYRQNCLDRRENSCYSFEYDTNGFTGRIKLDSPKLVFFSVPYEKGWKAEVNGIAAKVERVDYGFMAVRCPAGDNEIKFSYSAQGQKAGAVMTAMGVAALFIYAGPSWYAEIKKRNGGRKKKPAGPDNGEDK